MMQEMGLGPKDPNYVNPFSHKEDMAGKTEVYQHTLVKPGMFTIPHRVDYSIIWYCARKGTSYINSDVLWHSNVRYSIVWYAVMSLGETLTILAIISYVRMHGVYAIIWCSH